GRCAAREVGAREAHGGRARGLRHESRRRRGGARAHGLARCWRIRLTGGGRGRVDTRRGEQRGGDRGRQSSRSLSSPHTSHIETSADRVIFVSTLPRAELFWSTHHAARLWLGLRRFGHDRMAVMEGGIQKWIAEGRPLETGARSIDKPAVFTPRPREGVVASKEDVLAAVRSGDPWLLDVRRDSEFTGVEKRAARGGHIPGAVNILWKDALQDDWTLRDANELEEFYTNAGFGPETSTITYCQAGVRAAFTHLVLTALGHDEVRTYDGSWEEWGNDPSLPIITGRS